MHKRSAELSKDIIRNTLVGSAGALLLVACSDSKNNVVQSAPNCTTQLSSKADQEVAPVHTPDMPVLYAKDVTVEITKSNGDKYTVENPIFTRLPDQTWCVGFRTYGQDASSREGNYATAFPLSDKNHSTTFRFTGKNLPANGAANFDPSDLPSVVIQIPVVDEGNRKINIPNQDGYHYFVPDEAARKRLVNSDIAPIQKLPETLELGNLTTPS